MTIAEWTVNYLHGITLVLSNLLGMYDVHRIPYKTKNSTPSGYGAQRAKCHNRHTETKYTAYKHGHGITDVQSN